MKVDNREPSIHNAIKWLHRPQCSSCGSHAIAHCRILCDDCCEWREILAGSDANRRKALTNAMQLEDVLLHGRKDEKANRPELPDNDEDA